MSDRRTRGGEESGDSSRGEREASDDADDEEQGDSDADSSALSDGTDCGDQREGPPPSNPRRRRGLVDGDEGGVDKHADPSCSRAETEHSP
jgi:hypothetical protein